METIDSLKPILKKIYGDEKGMTAFNRLAPIVKAGCKKHADSKIFFSEKDIILISYGDTITDDPHAPLKTLLQFANRFFKNVFSTIHLLPFFPFSSDDGFSVIDFFAVDPLLGTWDDICEFNSDFKLMFDFVLNHVSSESQWFQNYLNETESEKEFAIEAAPSDDLSKVVRPRALPLLTKFKKKSGKDVLVWTTFSDDQIDLNYNSLDVLEKMVRVLLRYIEHGAKILRLDAIAYLWKQTGTSCIHLSQTHEMVRLFRKILNIVSPEVMILTETNVPHKENISYFGDGMDEAQMVYNFTLPPLLLYSIVKKDAGLLSEWAKTLQLAGRTNTFLNFTASHDGIGIRPLEGILPDSEIEMLCSIVEKKGGHISYKENPDKTRSPYELNITYMDAVSDISGERESFTIKRFLASQAIQYVLPGIPATYIHSILGSRNWIEGVKMTGRYRTINREKINLNDVLNQLKKPDTFRSHVFYPYLDLIRIRRSQTAFHPKAGFEVLDIHSRVFGIARYSETQTIYALTNISDEPVLVSLPVKPLPPTLTDLVTGKFYDPSKIHMSPYQYAWLSVEG